ncbi:MAG: YihY/virulence factor BrkB family protein [Thermomicrobiales bacterium]|nr:YihY/virulence factor BrkB family protein [Thermomicrobiales bacterium]
MKLPGFHGANPLGIFKQAIQRFLKHDLSTYAAALAYSTLFAIFPFLIFLIALLSALDIPQFFDWLLDQSESAMPADAYSVFEGVIEGMRGSTRGGVLSIGIVAAIWGASSGVRSVMNAMNVAFGVEESRALPKRYLLSVVYTLGLAALLIASAGLVIVGPDAMNWIADQADLGDLWVTLWTWLRFPVLALLLTIAVALIYYVAPDVDQRFTLISPGAVVAVIVWLVAAAGFSFYISGFSDYSATYGSLAGIIILLTFLYLSSAVLLLGAEINAVLEHQRRNSVDTSLTAESPPNPT